MRHSDQVFRDDRSVAVVIPVFNGEMYLAECIQSVLNQTHKASEIIVVDDGSTDRSADIARSFDSVTVFSRANSGVSASRNFGASRTRSQWLAFLDADDVWLPMMLELQLDSLDRQGGDVSFAGRRLLYATADRHRFTQGEQTIPPATEEIVKKLKLGLSFTPSCAVVSREAFERIGGFNRSASPCEDWEMWLRLAAVGTRFTSCRRVLMIYRMHPSNASNQGLKMYAASMRTWESRVAPHLSPLTRPFKRAIARSGFLAALARVNRGQCIAHIRFMFASLLNWPFSCWDRYAALASMLLNKLGLLS